MIRILILLIIVVITACNNVADDSAPKGKTQTDSLMDEVMEGHNVAMGKISKLHQTKSQLQQLLDSISKLPTNAQKNSANYKTLLDSAFKRLTRADEAMDKWMNEFNMDSAANDVEKRSKYLESEKIKVSDVRDEIINSLQSADSLIRNGKQR